MTYRVAVGYAVRGKEFDMGKHDDDDKKEGDGKWDKPIPPKNPPGGGKHEKSK
ncbi:hypothetical protein [Actinomadura meridiana]|uniref:hypothetical protein n=1 Tax=Actinomadura meridiana TaxID=559626 RepID=UPI0031E9DD99